MNKIRLHLSKGSSIGRLVEAMNDITNLGLFIESFEADKEQLFLNIEYESHQRDKVIRYFTEKGLLRLESV